MATSEIGIKIGLQGAESVTSGLQRVGVSMGQLSGQVDTVRNALSTLAPTLAGALTVGGLVAFVRQTVNAVDAMNDLADATGASIEEISKLDQVARRNGASLDQVGGMLVKFNAQLKEADGKNGASIALEAIGLSAAKLRQLDPAEALRQTAVALAGFENDANKARITQELFGKSVREAAPFLNDLAEAGELNASVTAEQAAQADKFNKQLFAFQANAGDAARVITQELLPTLSAIAAEFNRTNAAGDTLAKFFGTGLRVVLQALAVLATDVAFVFKGVGRDLGGMAAQIAALAKGDFAGFSFIRKGLIEDSIQARKELDALQARILGVQETARAADAARAREDRGFVPGGPRSVIDIAAEQARRKAAEQASVAAAKALDDEAKAIGEAIKQRERYLETLSAGTDKIAKETQALADQVAQVVLGKQAFQNIIDAREEEQAVILETQAVRALDRNLDAKEFDSLKAQAQAIRDRINARKALATATVEATDREIMARRSAFKDQDAQEIIDTERLKNSQSIIDAINRETEALQMSNVEREVAIALLAAEARGIKAGSYEYEEYAKNIRAAIVNRETVRASIEQTKTIEQEWRRTSDQIGQSLTDALMQGGKSAWEYIKGLFRSMVLRPIIQAAVNPIVGSLGGGGGGALSTLGSINSLATLGSVITGSVASSIGNVMGTAGTMFGSSALTAFSAGMKGATLAPGLMGPTTVGASGAMGAGASAAAAIPYVAAALAVANALGVFRSRSIVGGGLTGTLGMGDIQSYDLQRRGGTLFSGPEYSMVNRQTSTESAAIQSAFNALRTNAASMAEALGLSSTAVKSFTTTLGTDITQNDIGTRGIKLDGLTPEQAAKKVEEALAAANEDLAAFVLGASRTVTETLTTRIEDWEQTESGSTFRGFIDQVSEVTRTIEATGTSYARAGETNVQTLTRLATSLSTINPALELLGLNLYATSLAGADLASQLADAFGGLENFTQASAAYYAEFFTEAERTAKTTAQLTEALGGLGLALPTTRDAYRQLVEAQDLTTEAGRKNFAVLVQLSGTFAGITPVLEDVAEASDQATEALRSAADILRERQGLERQLLQLQGDTAALRALDRAALDESNRALFDRITALQDSQAAEAAAAEATRTAAAAAEEAARAAAAETQRIGQERLGLERQLLQLQGDTAALRALDRAALDATNRALFDRIAALEDEQAAAAAAAQAQRDYAAAVETARGTLERARAAVLSAQSGVDAVRAAGTSAYLSAQDRVAAAQGRIADITSQLADQARSAALSLRELGASLQEFVAGEFTAPDAAFAGILRKALGGDSEAMRGLPDAARAAIDLARSNARTAAEAATERARILSSVAEVAAVAAATVVPAATQADPMLVATQELTAAQTALADALSVANAIGAPLTRQVEDLLVQFKAAGDALTKALADQAAAAQVLANIELNTSNTVNEVQKLQSAEARGQLEVILKAVADSNLPDDIKALISGKGTTFTATITAVVDSALSVQEKNLLLSANTTAARAVVLSAAFTDVLTSDEKKALQMVDETVTKTIAAAVSTGTLSSEQKQLLAQQAESVTKIVRALVDTGQLTQDQKNLLGLLSNSTATNSTVTLQGTVTFDPSNALRSIFDNITRTNTLLAKTTLALMPETASMRQKATFYSGFRELYTDAETRRIAETLFGPQTDKAWEDLKKAAGFALGGVFANGLVTSPTAFPMGVMGEAGPEAIMPLGRSADGSLGVRMFSDNARREEALVAEIRALRAEMEGLRAEARSTAVATNKTARILDRVTPDGTSLQTVAAT